MDTPTLYARWRDVPDGIASLVLICLNIIKVRVLRATKETRHAQDQ